MHAFQARKAEFEAKGVELIAVSTDTEQSHWGWLQMTKDQGGIEGVTYPIVADTNKTISHNYDVLDGEWTYDEEGNLNATGEMIAYRSILDRQGRYCNAPVGELLPIRSFSRRSNAYGRCSTVLRRER